MPTRSSPTATSSTCACTMKAARLERRRCGPPKAASTAPGPVPQQYMLCKSPEHALRHTGRQRSAARRGWRAACATPRRWPRPPACGRPRHPRPRPVPAAVAAGQPRRLGRAAGPADQARRVSRCPARSCAPCAQRQRLQRARPARPHPARARARPRTGPGARAGAGTALNCKPQGQRQEPAVEAGP